MAKLIYSAIASLDGYVEDEEGNFDWAAPDEEVHAFVNDLERPIGTYLYGRRMYETMVYWETARDRRRPAGRDAGLRASSGRRPTRSSTPRRWRRCPARGRGSSGRSTPTRSGAEGACRRATSPSGGPDLAGQAIAAGLVDECHLFLIPIVVGGGKRALPADVRVQLELLDERRFGSGVVYLRYRVSV